MEVPELLPFLIRPENLKLLQLLPFLIQFFAGGLRPRAPGRQAERQYACAAAERPSGGRVALRAARWSTIVYPLTKRDDGRWVDSGKAPLLVLSLGWRVHARAGSGTLVCWHLRADRHRRRSRRATAARDLLAIGAFRGNGDGGDLQGPDGHDRGRAEGGARGARRDPVGKQGVAAAAAARGDRAHAPREH